MGDREREGSKNYGQHWKESPYELKTPETGSHTSIARVKIACSRQGRIRLQHGRPVTGAREDGRQDDYGCVGMCGLERLEAKVGQLAC